MTTTPAPPLARAVDAEPVARAPRARGAAAGLLAGGLALVAGELAGRLPGASSPVIAVGDAVVALAPPSARDAGISTFGTLDKPLLVGGVLLVCLSLAAAAGMRRQTSPGISTGMVAVLALLGALAVAADSGSDLPGAVLIGLVLLGTGLAALRLLLPVRPATAAVPSADRRAFLVRAGAASVLLVSGAGLVRLLDLRSRVTSAARAALRLPAPVRTAPGDLAAAELGLPGLSPVVTPNRAFYRIDTALVVPQVDPAGWSLSVDGLVDRPLRLTLEDLLALPQVEADITIACVSNEVGGNLVGLARWQGVRLRDVLERAGLRPGAEQVVGVSVDGFTAGFPVSYATDDRFSMIALGMNGELLPVEHGFPARLIVPGLYGYVSATKWLSRITLTTWAGFDGFWIPRGWSKLGPIKVASRIDVPSDGATVAAGRVVVAGMAWAPGRLRGVTEVQARVDRGPWQQATLAGALSEDAWRQWRLDWDADPGVHLLEVRAVDRTGDVQSEQLLPPRPDGATGLHAVRVRVV